MNGPGFTYFYLNSTRVGTRSDLECFYYSWYDVYGCSFNDSTPWGAKDPKYKVPKICTMLKTRMLSKGSDSATATRVINSFKKWYKDTYPDR